ncbi:unnamed protein product [Mytilus coruscus]|uniref:Uncharacterized protein n=1 Tax=Mytilus coruscus TaxID=42192 RepID=A0A6J8EPH4_MYTCO|nr:unnamed protein product [Mytilus coruscus]
MLLDKEISEFSAEMYLELIMMFNNDINYDETNSFKEEEDLRTLNAVKLKNRLEKSLSVSTVQVEKMLNKELESSDLIRLCHIGIELANTKSSENRRQEKKRKAGSDDSSPSKKISGEPTPTCDNCASGEMSLREEDLNDRILELDSLLQSTKYSKQKLVLQKSIVSFLSDLNPQKAGDLGLVLTDQVRWLPGEEGVIISIMKGKTIDISDPRVVILYNSVYTEFCPVLREYIDFCKVSKLEIVGGYLFRPLASSFIALSDVPFTSAAANARLKSHLTDLNIWEGETPHSTRIGCALTLTWLGLNSECIKSHVGWKSDKMLKHYTVTNEINEKSVSARSLAKLSDSEISLLTGKYQRFNNFEHLKKTTQLKAEIELLKKGINVDVVEQALKEVKEYAARSREINVDTLQLKLMHLDEVARRVLSSADHRIRPDAWEYSNDFLPALVNPRLYHDVQYVDVKNILVTQDMRTFDCNKDVLNENLDEDIYFLDPSRFVAGNVHKNKELWGKLWTKTRRCRIG